KLRIQTGDYSWLYWWAALGATGGAFHFVRTGRWIADRFRNDPSFSANTLVSLVQPGRVRFYRSILCLDHRSESQRCAVRVVRLAALFSALAHCAGAADWVWRSRSRRIRCAVSPRHGIGGFTHRRRRLSRRRRDYGGDKLSTN